MAEQRTVLCQKFKETLPGIPFKPFASEFGQLIYDRVSMRAWQEWLKMSPRLVNTYRVDLQTAEGQKFLEDQMRVFFGFAEGDVAETAWRPPEK